MSLFLVKWSKRSKQNELFWNQMAHECKGSFNEREGAETCLQFTMQKTML